MGISKGTVNECVTWVCNAILKVQKQVIKWLNEEERKIFNARIRKTHGFVNCVGLIDGTLFPLAFAPTLNVEDYFTRKGNYAFKGLFIFDDAAKITWIEMVWPSSVHNNQVWSNSDVYLSKDKYFNNKEYLLDDSAFSVSLVMVPAFKKGHNPDSKERKYFNTKLAKVRIKNEHCIGLFKVRFECLQGHWQVIRSKHDLDLSFSK